MGGVRSPLQNRERERKREKSEFHVPFVPGAKSSSSLRTEKHTDVYKNTHSIYLRTCMRCLRSGVAELPVGWWNRPLFRKPGAGQGWPVEAGDVHKGRVGSGSSCRVQGARLWQSGVSTILIQHQSELLSQMVAHHHLLRCSLGGSLTGVGSSPRFGRRLPSRCLCGNEGFSFLDKVVFWDLLKLLFPAVPPDV